MLIINHGFFSSVGEIRREIALIITNIDNSNTKRRIGGKFRFNVICFSALFKIVGDKLIENTLSD